MITATHRILERLVSENTVYAKIEYNGRKEVEMIDSKALKEAIINAIVHIENIGSGILRILDAYDKSCFKFMEHFLRVSFKYKENPFKYDDTEKAKSSKLGSKKSSK